MFKLSSFSVAVILIFTVFFTDLSGQRIYAVDQSTIDRLNQLEAEAQALRAEVSKMRQDVVRLPNVELSEISTSVTLVSNTTDSTVPAPPVPWSVPSTTTTPRPAPQPTAPIPVIPLPAVAQADTPKAVPPEPPVLQTLVSQPTTPEPTASQEDYYTLDEIKAEMKKMVWKKGDFSVTPYGSLWAATTYETERTNNGDYTFYVFSKQDQGEPTYHVDAKSTRIGFDVLGPRIPCLDCAQSGGKVEFDFQGTSSLENKGTVLLRHAYWGVKNEEFRLLGGQTWDVISPLYPGSIMYTVYWGAGNIGYRRAQFRAERYVAISDDLLWTTQASINGNIVADTPPATINASGDQSEWPILEGRTALTFGPRGKGCHPIVLGASSHIGEQRFTFVSPNPVRDLRAKTWSLNADLRAPITDRFGFQGEYQIGEDLSTFYGGILQGYDFALRNPVYDTGGWMEVWYDWTPSCHSHVGYCVDDPLDRDLSAGSRTYNSAYFGNLVYDVTKQFNCGLELSSWRTLYKGKAPGEAVRIEFMAKYGF
jgi:hypothetical protein